MKKSARPVWILITLLAFSACLEISKWGNRIDFVNELRIEIDSLSFSVCGEKSMMKVFPRKEGGTYIADNPVFPESGYPCPVKIVVYSHGQEMELVADTFDCYHCDNAKYYILKDGQAVFQTHYSVLEQ